MQALRELDRELLGVFKQELTNAGDLVRDDARTKMAQQGARRGKEKSWAFSASGFQTRVRTSSKTSALVVVAQSKRSSRIQQRRRPNWGGILMRKGLLPARTAKLDAVASRVEQGVGRLLDRHGF